MVVLWKFCEECQSLDSYPNRRRHAFHGVVKQSIRVKYCHGVRGG